ncbi:MAG: hypothetical protein CO186_02195 [Zetaproteobacteria bacterium CG_4_9_14_3_um_filter_49_83]|nr:MAG: hypothetical protein AUJ56_06240 [Zetaproteobacteria bacterium CG1_02_49_23]PIQ33424.1 MAG: hypothetical protein COW62_04960 [Zetaproteobacteria bacterium CG17_big_fil_post_rev_8_21_14_2_50_50_13]PIV30429.1 MAG: hypothetical protein COS35_06785 [Zetaproteobacteria bacterium CG02_land_8_20_14_3_00_50_9]PIY55631.1 MAG: hypothetical protein COZ00_08025 [Zetaproteobacteria bacterium CG_4_10_14_0_8_um_filter_49_80]PJA35980.1 MAG: hypothetical protein CO186_02195 [Zetaproteobacteria bacterium
MIEIFFWGTVTIAVVVKSWLALAIFPTSYVLVNFLSAYCYPLAKVDASEFEKINFRMRPRLRKVEIE